MATKDRPAPAVIPFLQRGSLYVGIDVGKTGHVAAFVSRTLLESAKRYEACPVLRFENTRLGFRALVTCIDEYVPLEQAFVLLEGHYHLALHEYLLEMDLTVHELVPMERKREMLKTDKRDAQRLANQLYNQLELHAQVADKKQLVRLALPASRVAAELRELVQHRRELVREATKRKNQLTSICDQLFPEFTQVFKDPNKPTALAIRARYPTPHAVAMATLPKLCALRAADLKSFLGWSPRRIQTGTSVDRANLSPAGTRATRTMLFMAVMNAVTKDDNVWAELYKRLLPKRCAYDERKRDYVGKITVIGTVAGRMIGLIYLLLKTDAELLATILPGMESPDPQLYDPQIHRAHVVGGYVPAKKPPLPARIVQLPHRTEESL